MDTGGRAIFAALMSNLMACPVTLLITSINLGLPADFRLQQTKVLLAPSSGVNTAAFLVMPPAQRITRRIVTKIEGRA